MDVYVERLYAALSDAMRRNRPRAFEVPVTVAEIYQDLVPYRVVRASLGFELNADYEHALLQLLAGLGGLARLEPEEAAAELRAELRSSNPNVGLFRKFAACDVWIAPPAETEFEPEEDDEGFAPEPVEEEEQQPHARPPVGAESAPAATAPETSRAAGSGTAAPSPAAFAERDTDAAAAAFAERDADAAAAPSPAVSAEGDADGTRAASSPVSERAADAASPAPLEQVNPAHASPFALEPEPATSVAAPVRDTARRCGFCDAMLPAGRLVRFCPHCGGDQARRPCVACGESLEAAWRFCVSCGAQQGGPLSA